MGGEGSSGEETRPPRVMRAHGVVLAALLLAFGVTAAAASWRSTATADEPIYLAAGLRILATGDPETNEISSPWLLKPWLGLPLYLLGERVPADDLRMRSDRLALHWQSAWEVLHRPGRSSLARLRLARLMNVLLAMATVFLVYRLGRRSGGPGLGLAAAFLYATLPEVLAHAGLAGLDTGLTFLTTLTLTVALPLVTGESRHPGRVVGAGLLLGLTFLAKTAAIVLALFLGLVFLWRLVQGARRRPGAAAIALRLLVVLGLALLTIHAGFGFAGSGERLTANPRWPEVERRLAALPAPLGTMGTWSATHLPAPLPRPYVDLLLVQAALGAHGKEVWFHGARRTGGWPWFLPVALVLKTPLLHLLLLLAGLVLLRRRRPDRTLRHLLLFAAVTLVFLAATDRFGLVRYLLPIQPVVALVAALPLLALARAARRQLRVGAAATVVLVVGATAHAFPWYLSFLDEALGGPWHAHEWFVDSNADWGQDLARAADHARAHGYGKILLGYFGSGRAADHGLDVVLLPSVGHEPMPGDPWWFERPTPEPLPDPLPDLPLYLSETLREGVLLDDTYARFRDRSPDAMATPSIAVYLPSP